MKDSLENPNLAVERSQENTELFAEFSDALENVMKIAMKINETNKWHINKVADTELKATDELDERVEALALDFAEKNKRIREHIEIAVKSAVEDMEFDEDNVEVELSLYGRHIEIDHIDFNGRSSLAEDIIDKVNEELIREEELINAADNGVVIIENR